MKRWLPLKLLVPLILGLVLSMALLVFSELSYKRLEAASDAVSESLEIQATLQEILALVADAETGQRGYLLTQRKEYLEPYTAAAAKMEPRLAQLRNQVSNRVPVQRDRAGRLNNLVGKRMNELESTLTLEQRAGREVALELLSTDIGRRTMDEIRALGEQMTDEERRGLAGYNNAWVQDIDTSRVGMHLVTALTIGLILVVWLLASREMAMREHVRERMAQDQRRLEALVEERTAELSELSAHLQLVSEQEKAKLARDIHDELGSILVSAKMDVSWVQARVKPTDPESDRKLERAQAALDEGVTIKRRIIEELRPTLLDNLGLSSAVEWQSNEVCSRAGLKCNLNLPDDQEELPADVSIALFRIVQEALTNVVRYARAATVDIDITRSTDGIALTVHDDGIGIPDGAQYNRMSHGIAGMRHRVRALNGEFRISGAAGKGTTIEVYVPLAQTAAAEVDDRATAPA